MDKLVDVRKLIASKNKSLLKWIPSFLVEWLRNIIHEDEVNDFFVEHDQDDIYTFCKAAIDRFELQLSITGIEHIPPEPSPIILAGNHPLGGLDAISLIYLLKDTRTDIKFIVNDFLMAVKKLQGHFIGVNKVGKSAKESLHKVEEQFERGTATFVFPAGLVSRKTKGEIQDLEWKKTFITKAKKYNLPIIPMHIGGRLTDRFYRLAKFRKFLGIKFNIEMLYLVDEMFRQQGMNIDVVLGEPILPETFTKEKTDLEWAKWVKEKVYKLENK